MAGEWPMATLADSPLEIIDGDRGTNYPKQHDFAPSGHCLFLNAGNVTTSGFNFSDCAFISAEKDSALRKGKLRREDIVLTTRGTVGNVAYFDESVPYDHIRINSGMVILRARSQELRPRFLYLFLRSALFQSQVESLRTGSAQPQLPIRDINRVEISVPPLDEQDAIAHILGTLDDKIELNRRMNETLEAMARALFKSWFVDFLPVRATMAAKANDPSLPAPQSEAARQAGLLLPQAEAGTWYVYAIECNDGSVYIGQTEDLRQRWLQHVGGKGASWTKQHPPVRVPYWEKQPSREAAVERENWLKTGYGRKWLKQEIAARTQTGDHVRAKAANRADLLTGRVSVASRASDSACGPRLAPIAKAECRAGQDVPMSDERHGGRDSRPTDPGLPKPPACAAEQSGAAGRLADLFPDSFEDSELGEIPKGWSVGTLGDVAENPRRGVQPDGINPTTPYIALEHMPRRCIALSEWDVADGLESNKFEFKKGEILFGKLRPYFHKVGVAPVDGVCSTDIVVVTPRKQEWFGFVLGHVSSDAFVEYTNAGSTGTKMPRTSWSDMARYTVVIPPEIIAKALTAQIRLAVDRIIASIHEARTLAALRDTLLPKIISGELQVEDVHRAHT